ncbi:hypothetical protein AKJ66_03670 [candidate division MSBL1 archaeon SCGC-AAA259E22]|uniref:Aldehyde ferredoxin oxidoreductase N-terminal domain-containing protein n=1 Tax=candidate division MSBL1 archaeon SCGC-AAA259E22 TaxID=1698265 RepID=A0A133UET2_9EURY|nr:hypothetical protein AKJ66_03670 [candidate division MSBL1 archaeon SCGC-AAA259E22]
MTVNKEPKLLRVDLNSHDVVEEEIPEELIEKFIGGKGLAGYYLYKEVPPKADPLSSDNKLIYMTGPTTGYLPSTSRLAVVTKSPQYGGWLDTWGGGQFPAELRFTGYWGIIFEGKSEDWVSLKIDGSEASIETGDFQGKKTSEIARQVDGYKVSCIGPAGENLVKFACIVNDPIKELGRGGEMGREGAGAVMGSKRLKAIAVKNGKKNAQKEVPEELDQVKKSHVKRVTTDEDIAWARDDGTPAIVELSDEAGILPTKNFQKGQIEGAEKISMEAVREMEEQRNACYFCPIACSRYVKVKKGPYEGIETEGPEYETLAMAGSNTGVTDLGAIVAFNDICDKYGIDTMSAGAVIAWAMECTEKGIHDFGIEFGDGKALVEMAEKIALREGDGDILAEGVAGASEQVGGKNIAVCIKDIELPGYDGRGGIGQTLAYSTADRGADHNRSWPIEDEAYGDWDPLTLEGKAERVVSDQDECAAVWSLTTCDFALYSAEHVSEAMRAIGFDLSTEEVVTIGERIHNLARMFNVREGFDRDSDSVPERFTEPMKEGPIEGQAISPEDFEKLLSEYYSIRGWNEKGVPTQETLERLGIKGLIESNK